MRDYIKRAIHFDFHTMPKIPDLGVDFNAQEFASQLADAKVEYIIRTASGIWVSGLRRMN